MSKPFAEVGSVGQFHVTHSIGGKSGTLESFAGEAFGHDDNGTMRRSRLASWKSRRSSA